MKNFMTKIFRFSDILVYLIVIFVFSLILLYYNTVIGFVGMGLFVFLLYYYWRIGWQRKEELNRYIESLSENIDLATRSAVLSVPVPLLVIEPDGSISWYNSLFARMFEGESLIGKNIGDYIEDLDPRVLISGEAKHRNKKGVKKVELDGRVYRVFWNSIDVYSKRARTKSIILLYWHDITEEIQLKTRYEEEKPVMAYVNIDNYDEVMNSTEENQRPVLLAEIEGRLGRWVNSLNAGWKKYDKDKFVVIMEAKALKEVEESRFAILDQIREINVGNEIPVTLSIGVGAEGENPARLSEYAQSAIDLALGRGGDQAVVKRGDKLFFYGGRSKAVEKRTKVRSRVIANAFRRLMEQSLEVYIMGHDSPDLDALGAALGIYRCARHIGKKAYVILGKINPFVEYLVKELKTKEGYRDLFVTAQEARTRIDRQSVLVVVDTHRPSFTEAPELLDLTDRVVVIDHHRRSTENIENAILNYVEPYASSASELVTEIIYYFDEKMKLETVEADALLAGITTDTKNFTFKTGVRTFEAASYLRRKGADPTSVRRLFQDDLYTFVARSETVKNAKLIAPGVALSICPAGLRNASLIAAQAADSLLEIRGITASFVLSESEGGVIISGRSLGAINVQLILEKLGGGGHLTIAGAQLNGVSVEEAREKLIQAVEEYLKEVKNK